MSDPRWLRIEDEFEDACDYFRGAVRIFEKGILHGKDEAAWEARMAFMHAMQSGHTSLESGLERILALLDEEHPGGPNWHADLLLQVARPVNERGPILPREVYAQADETRRFRNIAVRNYGSFRSEEATRVVAAAKVLIDSLNGCLRDFRAQIDPPEHDDGGDGTGGSMGGGPR